jgi:hypothetical protein
MLSIAIMLMFTAPILVGMQSVSFVYAAYSVNSLQMSIQLSGGEYVESTIPLKVNASLVYGTTSIVDEFSLQTLICSYSLDSGEWKNITSVNVTSNESQPDMNYWYGLLHKLNVTFSTVLQGLSEGVHFINVTVSASNTHGNISDSDTVTFSVAELPSPPLSPSASPSPTETPSPTQSLVSSPSGQSTETPQPTAAATEIIYAAVAATIVIIVIAIVAIAIRKKRNHA